MLRKIAYFTLVAVFLAFSFASCTHVATANGISSIKKTSTAGLVDTYTITFADGATNTFTVTNGAQGEKGIQGIQGERGADGHTPVITIQNGNWYIDGVDSGKSAEGIKGETGNGISSIAKTSTEGLVDTYTITFTDGTTTTFTVTNGANGKSGYELAVEAGYTGTLQEWVARFMSTPVESVTLNLTEISLSVGESEALVATVLPANATDQSISWLSTDPAVATVDQNGVIHAIGSGKTSIIAMGADRAHACCIVSVENRYSEGLHYMLTSDETGYIVVGMGLCSDIDVVIPETYKGKPVVEIYNSAFAAKPLRSVTIPNSVETIGDSAFSGCTGLTSVTIGNGVESIGGYAFRGCTGLTSVTIPNSVTSIGNQAFYYCTGLTSVTIPNSVTSIGNSAFYCTGLTSVTIPNSVTSIGDSAFSGCTGLTSVTIPNSVTSIGDSAFSGCTGLTSVTIPNSVKTIGSYAFFGCTGLTSVTIPNSVTSIGNSAFYCTGLTSVTIPNGVKSIGEWAFSYCTGLTSVTIPNSVTSIGGYAFYGCTGLQSVNVTDIASWCGIAFADYGANPLYYAKNLQVNGVAVTELVIPEGVTSIGAIAFYGCTGLTSVTIPNSVKTIGIYAFSDCTALTIYCEAAEQPAGWDSRWNPSNHPVVWNYKPGDPA